MVMELILRIPYIICYYHFLMLVLMPIGRLIINTPSFNAGKVYDSHGNYIGPADDETVRRFQRKEREENKSIRWSETYWEGIFVLAMIITPLFGANLPHLLGVLESLHWIWKAIIIIIVMAPIIVLHEKVGDMRFDKDYKGICRFIFLMNIVRALIAFYDFVLIEFPNALPESPIAVAAVMPYVLGYSVIMGIIILVRFPKGSFGI